LNAAKRDATLFSGACYLAVNLEYYELDLAEDTVCSLESPGVDISYDDPRLTEEVSIIDPSADAYAKPSMSIRDDGFRVVLRLGNYR
jgi:hypothetical protein